MTHLRRRIGVFLVACAVVAAARAALAADPPFKVPSPDGKSYLTIGFLVQPLLETLRTGVIVTYAFRDEFQLDAGLLLFPRSHNTGQSVGTLLAIDYGSYSLRQRSMPTLTNH